MATTYYNANQNLKAVGVPVEFTEEQVKEYIKCKRNPIYFIENYCKIVSLDEGVVDFKLYACQKRKTARKDSSKCCMYITLHFI